MRTTVRRAHSAVYIGSAIALMSCLTSAAHSQSRTPNPDAPSVLRTWPTTGQWVTILGRTDNQTLVCSMMTGKAEAGHIEYFATLTHWPSEWHIGLSDVNQIIGSKIALIIDGVRVGNYPITKRQDNSGPLHIIGAIIPGGDSTRVLALFRTGATVQFVTDQLTYSFPLTGAAQSLFNLQNCISEANNLAGTKTGTR